jgi:hypothetical protein
MGRKREETSIKPKKSVSDKHQKDPLSLLNRQNKFLSIFYFNNYSYRYW